MRLTPEAESLVNGKSVIYLKTDVAKWSELENIVTVSRDVFGDVPDVYVAGAAVFEPVQFINSFSSRQDLRLITVGLV